MGTKSFEDGFSRTVKVFGSITVVLSVVVIGLYFFQFNDKLSTNQEDFALFGDFLAGTLTPILTFFTIVLLIMSIKYQVSELKNSTQALNDTKTIHLQSLQLQQENLKIQERNNLIPIAIERLDKMYTQFKRFNFALYLSICMYIIADFPVGHDLDLDRQPPVGHDLDHQRPVGGPH